MGNGILVFAEYRDGVINKTTFEAIAAAQEIGKAMGQPVDCVLPGSALDTAASQIAEYDIRRVLAVSDDKLSTYTPDGFTDAVEQIIRAEDSAFVIFPHTYLVRDFAPKLSARFKKGLISDCIRAKVDDGAVILTRRIFAGKLDSDVFSGNESPVFITFQSGAYRGDKAAKGSGAAIETRTVTIGEVRMKPEPPFQEVKQAVDLSKADIIVAIGRGIKSKENIALAEELAKVLGGDIAASRPICDAEWLPIDRQIGSSGQTVAPKLYIALGISGAIQHLVGMKNSNTIVAINKDPEAPIFDIADYGIIGDLFEAVPVLTEEIRKRKA